MARINNLIDKVKTPELRQMLLDEVNEIKKQKKFGLVFEEHLPEATPLYELPIVKGCLVSERSKRFDSFYLVEKVDGEKVYCERQDESHEKVTFKRDKIVRIALFGQPIYPSLQTMDEVKRAPQSNLWHTLIEAENYHALQLLVYLYAGKVDCIYIDPPYNTGDKSWKYNNDYVDSNDSYRHSKWLSMMKKRLLLAKRLLNPKDSVLIVTIDEKEYLRLGCLLEEMFPDSAITMITDVTNPRAGVARDGGFRRTQEYIYYVQVGIDSKIASDITEGNDKKNPIWFSLMRTGSNSSRIDRKNLFYPVWVNTDGSLYSVGTPIGLDDNKDDVVPPSNNIISVWPLRPDGRENTWQLGDKSLRNAFKEGTAKINFHAGKYTLNYLRKAEKKRITSGEILVKGRDENGALILEHNPDFGKSKAPGPVWENPLHDAGLYGSSILASILPDRKFPYPKSLYAEKDAIRYFVKNKPNALIVDFFAGSGTTLHAVNLLNAEDNGNRRCIMVTNNEVSAEEEAKLKRKHLQPGMEEWDKLGIARYVNWPRTKCSILGNDVNGNPLTGYYQTNLKQEKEKERIIKQISLIDDPSSLKIAQKQELVALCCQGKLPKSLVKAKAKYIVSEDHTCSILFDINYSEEWLEALEEQEQVTELYIVTRNNDAFRKLKNDIDELLGKITEEEPLLRPMSDGFDANVKYFKLGFLDKYAVALHRQFRELLPILWMKSGCVGECPVLSGEDIPDALVFAENKMAILTNEDVYSDFRTQLEGRKDIENIFIIAKSVHAFLEMAQPFTWAKTYHLYKDYLDNFSINYDR